MCVSDDKLNITYSIVTGFFVACFDKTDVSEVTHLPWGLYLPVLLPQEAVVHFLRL